MADGGRFGDHECRKLENKEVLEMEEINFSVFFLSSHGLAMLCCIYFFLDLPSLADFDRKFCHCALLLSALAFISHI